MTGEPQPTVALRPDSVAAHMPNYRWDSDESVAYEVAIEAINGVVGAYSAVIAAEEAKAEPDERVIAAARDGQAACARERRTLDPTDHGQIAEATRRAVELARSITGR
jgi:hypothetical protein